MSSDVTLVTRSSGGLREVSTLVSGLLKPLRPVTRENFLLTESGLIEYEAEAPVDPARLARPVFNSASALEPTQQVPIPREALPPTSDSARIAPLRTVLPAARVATAPVDQVIVGDVSPGSDAFNDVTVRRSLRSLQEVAPRSSVHQVPLPDKRPTRADDLLGATLGGYTLTGLVGSRKEEWTYEGQRLGTDTPVVVKVLPPPARPRRETAEICRRTMAVKRLGHRNIVRVMDLVEDADKLSFIVLEQPTGEPLGVRLARCKRLPPRQAVTICLQICDALAAAHAVGLTPADLNLDSIYLDRGAQRKDNVTINDLGLRSPGASQSRDGSNQLSGSAWFRSPEERTGEIPTSASNIYSVGALLCYMLGGHVDHRVPPALAEIVIRCMAADPAQRFPTMVSVRAALERATGVMERARDEKQETRQRPALSLGLALLALVLALVALVGVVALSSGLSGLTGQTASIKRDGTVARGVAKPALPLPVAEALEAPQ